MRCFKKLCFGDKALSQDSDTVLQYRVIDYLKTKIGLSTRIHAISRLKKVALNLQVATKRTKP